MFGMKKMLTTGKILSVSILATEALYRDDLESAEKWFTKLSEFSLEDLQKTYFQSIKEETATGDIDEILDASPRFPDNALELITLVWKEDVDGIMDLMDHDKATFVGTFASITNALIDSRDALKGK